MPSYREDLAAYKAERDRVFRAIDVEAGKALFGLPCASDFEILIRLHKGRILWSDAPDAEFAESEAWLKAHRFAVPPRKSRRPLTEAA
jgi:hypothetical protein